jgi:hypothetical protein
VRIKQLGSAQHLGRYIEGSRELTGSNPEKPSQPITEHTRALSLSSTSPDFDDGITGVHQFSRRGANPQGVPSKVQLDQQRVDLQSDSH